MGVKLDWEIEAERKSFNGLGEHPGAKRRRRAARRNMIWAALFVIGLIVGGFAVVAGRLQSIDTAIDQQLRDTVRAEVNAINLGNIGGYLNALRSESNTWMLEQTDRYWEYQQLKLDRQVELTGRALEVTVEEHRARVHVEEIIDGQRFQVMWFYWRYEDGWRHVPPDVTFWGDEEGYEDEGQTVHVACYGLDEGLVEALIPSLERVWGQACNWLGCAAPLPLLTVRVLPDATVGVSWSADQPDTLLIASPLTGRAPLDTPLSEELKLRIGRMLIERIIDHATGGLQPPAESDATFLLQAVETWLTWRFMDDNGTLESGFIASLVEMYGEDAVARLVPLLQPGSSIAVLANALSLNLDVLSVDWRDFFQWRLALEPVLLSQGNGTALSGLYDMDYGDVAQTVTNLLNDPGAAARPVPTVLQVTVGPGVDGVARACVAVQEADGSEGRITFRLANGVWRRSAPDAVCG